MSDILIRGMELPKEKSICVEIFADGGVHEFASPFLLGLASELPEHGDLIDRSKLLDEFIRMQKLMDDRGHEFSCSFMSSGMEISTEWYCVEDVVNAAKTIIPASEKGGNE